MRQYSYQTIRSSNDLVDGVAVEIALSQEATALVDGAAADLLGVNATDLHCLGRLHASGATTAGGLARACGLTPGAMTTALDRLERAGYVRRVRREADRRRVTIEVTGEAQRLLESIWGPIGLEGKTQLAGFSDDQLRFLLEFLRRGRELQESHAARIRQMAASSSPVTPPLRPEAAQAGRRPGTARGARTR